MIHKVKDLFPDQRALLESLLGRRPLAEEAVIVRAFEPTHISDEERQKVADELRKYFAEIDTNRKPVSADEANEIITEALRSTRPSYRPRR